MVSSSRFRYHHRLKNPVDGVKGRAAMISDVATGEDDRGQKLAGRRSKNLLSFAGDAYLNEMGITSRLFPTENAPNGNTTILNQLDTVIDPRTPWIPPPAKADIHKFARLHALPRAATAHREVHHQHGLWPRHLPADRLHQLPHAADDHRFQFHSRAER